MENIIPSIVIFGNTGSGKSTLANTLVGQENVFKESNEVESETKETKGEYGFFDHQLTFIIDTPGINDASGLDSPHLVSMAQYIKEHIEIKAFIIVINFILVKLDEGVKRLFQLVDNMYPGKKWYHNLGVVWSNYYPELNEKKKEKQPKIDGFKRFIKNYIVPSITDDELNNIPQYFVDSIEAREENNNRSREELKHLITWASQLKSLNENLGEIQEVEAEIKSREEEFETKILNEKTILNTKYILKSQFKREKLTMYNGMISYTDWEEVPDTRKETKEILPIKPVGKPTIEKRKRIENEKPVEVITGKRPVGNRRYILFGPRKRVNTGFIEYATNTINEERTCQPMNDGTIKYGEWVEKSRKRERSRTHF